MARSAALVAAVALVALGISAASANNAIVETTPAALGISVASSSVFYDVDAQQTVFFYDVTTTSESLSRWVLTAPDNACLTLVDSDDEWELGTDSVSGATGYIHEFGEVAGMTRKVSIRFNGKIGSSSASTVTITSGSSYAEIAGVVGPDCTADSDYVEQIDGDREVSADCGSFPATNAQPADDVAEDSTDDRRIDGSCPQTYTIIRTLTASNNSLESRATQTISVSDSTAPTFAENNRTVIVECNVDAIPALPNVEAGVDDDCSEWTVSFCNDTTVREECPQNYVQLNTWTAVDECGNSNCFTMTIVHQDTLPPMLLNVPDDITLNCTDAVPAAANVTATDLCCIESEPVFSEKDIQGECGNTREIHRTWTVSDCCGNTASATQVISVVDMIKPEFSNPMGKETFECPETPTAPTVTATDNCQDADPAVDVSEPTITGTQCSRLYTYTYTAVDDCWNMASLNWMATVVDTAEPVFDEMSLPGDTTTTCDNIPPASTDVTCSDACTNTTITFTETNTTTDCPNEYIITRKWECSDECGRSASPHTQTITVIDTTAPVITTELDNPTVQCFDDVPAALPASSIEVESLPGGCDDKLNVTLVITNSSDDECDMVITRTYTATDCSGNNDTLVQVITVKDDTPPQTFGNTGELTFSCFTDLVQGDLVMADNCACPIPPGSFSPPNCNPPVKNEPEVIEGTQICPGTYDLLWTWTTTDDCGNVKNDSQIVKVIDDGKPQFDNLDSLVDLFSECDALQDRPNVTATDNCTDATVTDLETEREDGGCPNNYTLIYRYVAEDECGNNDTLTLRQFVTDETAPQLFDVPADDAAPCDAVPCPADVRATDNCDGLTVEYKEERVDGDCPHSYTLVRTWTATDACGYTVTDSQNITVTDNEEPTFDEEPKDLTQECDMVEFPPAPNATDNCGEVNITTAHSNQTMGGVCEVVYSRAFLATDECGNSKWFNYTITTTDMVAPVVTAPADTSFECELSTTGPASATDNCDLAPQDLGFTDSEVSREGDHCFVVERTFSFEDDCENVGNATQTITVYDNEMPVFPAVEAELRFECEIGEVTGALTPTDNCDTFDAVEPSVSNDTECVHRYVQTRTWTVTDSCGNGATTQQIVTVFDDQAPVLTGVPANDDVDCAAVPCPATVTATDNCVDVTLDYNQTRADGDCAHNYELTRTWTATDACGETTTGQQVISVTDTTAPTVTGATDVARECNETVTLPMATVTDDCSEFTPEDFTFDTPGNCTQNFVRNHATLYTDDCGNSAWFNFTETVTDSDAPFVVSWDAPAIAQDFTWSTAERCDFPELPVPTLDDNCDNEPTSDPSNTDSAGDCPYDKTRVISYVFSDECGNEATEGFTWTIEHSTAPTWNGALPQDVNRSCDAAAFEPATLTCTDACGATVIAMRSESSVPACGKTGVTTYTWTCADQCGLSINHTQVVTTFDNTAPTVTAPMDINREWSPLCEEAPLGTASVTDNCDEGLTADAERLPPTTTDCPYEYSEMVNYTSTDECGNVGFDVQSITYTHTTLPTLAGVPTNYTIQCDESERAYNVSATDACGDDADVFEREPVYDYTANGDCNNTYDLTRCWYAKDKCGLESADECVTISVVDTQRPMIMSNDDLSEQTVECGFVPGYPNVTVSDNCPGVELTLTVTEVVMDNCCWRKITRTWTAVDACGLEAVPVTQVINVEDTIPPVLFGVPGPVSAACPYEIEDANVTAGEPPLAIGWCAADNGVVADSCGVEAGDSASLTGLASVGDLNFVDGSHFIRYNDAVGRAIIGGQLTDGTDTYDLVLELSGFSRGSGVQELNASCYDGSLNSSTWRLYDTVEGNISGIAGTSTASFELCSFTGSLQSGMGANGRNRGMGVRAELATSDASGIVLRASLTADGQDGCDLGDSLFPRKHILLPGEVSDYPELECNDTIPVEYNETETGDICRTVTRRCWFAEDAHGNRVEGCQDVTVTDEGFPVISGVPPSERVACQNPLPCPADVTGTDECSDVTLAYTQGQPVNRTCEHAYDIVRTWTAEDECGHVTTDSQIIHVFDTEAPVIVGIDANAIFTCAENVTLPTVTATDNCDTVEVSNSSEIVEGNCSTRFRVNYIFRAEDDCGNNATQPWHYTVTNDIMPVITPLEPKNIACDADVVFDTPTCSHPCYDANELTLDFTETGPTGDECSSTYTRTWSCSDECGNEAVTVTQTITTEDTEAPTCTPPTNTSIECDEDLPAPPTLECDDNCDTSAAASLVSDVVVDMQCANNYTQRRTWEIVDCAGLSNTYVQDVVVRDMTPPTLTGVPPDDTFECPDLPCPASVTAEDTCVGIDIDYEQTEVPGSCGGERVVTRTWTATDACGLETSDEQVITLIDRTAPTCEPIDDFALSCDEFSEAAGTVAPDCTDACSTISMNLVRDTESDCDEDCASRSEKFNWNVTDACGNSVWVNYTVTVNGDDTVTLKDVPPAAEFQCEITTPPTPPTTEPALCSTPNVTSETSRVNGSCPYNYTVTYDWTATGCCGVTDTAQTVYTVSDTDAPEFDGDLPQDIVVNCTDIPDPVNLTCTDACTGAIDAALVTSDPGEDADSCVERDITHTWTCTDECGLATTHVQIVTVVANKPPTLVGVPGDDEQECDETDFSTDVTATDDCAGDNVPVVVSNRTIESGVCPQNYILEQTFTATDDCQNVATAARNITVVDTGRPTFDVCDCTTDADCVYCNKEYECLTAPNVPLPDANDDCDADVEVDDLSDTTEDRCNEVREYSFLATDDCGNTRWLNFTHTVVDTGKPEFDEFPADTTDECYDLDDIVAPTGFDACGNDGLQITSVNTTTCVEGECQNCTNTYTWTITDACGNNDTRVHTVDVFDDEPPKFVEELPGNLTFECDEAPQPMMLTATDSCGEATVDFADEPIDDGDDCNSTRVEKWTWTAVDACGLTTTHSIYVTFNDTTAPVLAGVPPDTTVECDEVPCPADVTATDNCGGLTLEYGQTETEGNCTGSYTIERTWTATDCNGNTVSETQTITVVDTKAPTPGDVPTDETVECNTTVVQQNITGSDTCSDVTVEKFQFAVPTDECEANVDYLQFWTIVDECFNSVEVNRTVRVRDTEPPTIVPVPTPCIDLASSSTINVEIEDATVPGRFFTAADSCSEVSVTITGCRSNQDQLFRDDGQLVDIGAFTSHCFYNESTDTLTINGLLSPLFPEGRVYVLDGLATDACGNTETATAQIYLRPDFTGVIPEYDPQDYIANLTGEFALPANFSIGDQCTGLTAGCVGDCPCETADELCIEGNEFTTVLVEPLMVNADAEGVYDDSADTTTWSYRIEGFGSDAPARVTFGLDLSRVQIVSTSPADVPVMLGEATDTYVSGVMFDTSGITDPTDVTITIRGRTAENSEARIPVVVGGGRFGFVIGEGLRNIVPVSNPCSGVRYVTGPNYDDLVYRSGSDVSGVVYVGGAMSGSDDTAAIPLAGVIVDLVDTTVATREVLASTMTAHDGSYSFNDVGDVANVGVALAADGFLRRSPNPTTASGLIGDLFNVVAADPTGMIWPYGLPVAVSAGSGNDINALKIDDTARPPYVRERPDGEELTFNGDSGDDCFWCHQLSRMGAFETAARLDDLIAAADLPAGCVDFASVCRLGDSTADQLQKQLAAAALNLADGRGITQPYDALNSIIFDLGKHVVCNGAGDASDQEAALGLLTRLNGADRVV